MNSSDAWSVRRSGRVEPEHRRPTENPRPGPISAPGSSTSTAHTYAGSAARSAAPAAPEGQAKPKPTRTTRHRLLLTDRDLSDRERAILQTICQHHFLTTRQIQQLFFTNHATPAAAARICRRTVLRLGKLRVIEPLERRVGGIRAGSASYVWRVGLVGDQLLRLASGDGVRARRKEPSARYLDHCLAGADVHVALEQAARQGQLDLVRFDAEPTSWRRYAGPGASRQILKPDLYTVTAMGDYEDHWFLEIDRATESIPTLLVKCQQYTAYRRTGREQQDGGVFPVVLWLVPDDRRLDRLTGALRSARSLDDDLFRVALIDQVIDVMTGAKS